MDPRIREILKYGIAFTVLLGVFFGGTYLLRGVLGTEFPMMVVVSESMVPTLGVGDYIFVSRITDIHQLVAAPIPEGEIIVFLRPGSGDEYIVHRVIRKIDNGGELSFVTKGDNNAFPDGTPVPEENIVGKVIGRAPIMGYFSLFIKTARGFGLIIGLMALAFFIDYIMPAKKEVAGRFPIIALAPTLFEPLVIGSFWFLIGDQLALETVAILIWYISCLALPLGFHDDDSGVMVWLYHIVLVMVPIACDIVWWTNGITPSRWWYTSGSTVPINWLLMKETSMFSSTFETVLKTILPGVAIFIATMYGKRKGWEPFDSIHRRLRGAPPKKLESANPIVSDSNQVEVN